MSDGDALLAAVLADPAADLARLVYADWLDEAGEAARAAAVRVMCAFPAATFGVTSNGPGRRGNSPRTWLVWPVAGVPAGGGRIRGLAAAVRRTLPDPAGFLAGSGFVVRRSLVAAARLPLAAFLAHAPGLFARHPLVAADLTDRRPYRDAAWSWVADDGTAWGVDEANSLPPDLARWLPAPGATGVPGVWRFASADAARLALSVACVAYGRAMVGLRPAPDACRPDGGW